MDEWMLEDMAIMYFADELNQQIDERIEKLENTGENEIRINELKVVTEMIDNIVDNWKGLA